MASFGFYFRFMNLKLFVHCTRNHYDYRSIIRFKFPNTSKQLQRTALLYVAFISSSSSFQQSVVLSNCTMLSKIITFVAYSVMLKSVR